MQQQLDPTTVQRSIAVLQGQRNQAMDAVANLEVRILSLTDELAKAETRIKELEKPEKPARATK